MKLMVILVYQLLITCGVNNEPYTFLRWIWNLKTQGCSIPDTTGYILDIKDQSIKNFNITAQCNKSMGYQGEAKVQDLILK